MIEARIILDSVSPTGNRLTTFELQYPRYIHSQLLTHRVFSRNAQSSRAERTEKLINRMLSNPVRPLEWRKAQKGMQPGDLMPKRHAEACRVLWDRAMWNTLDIVKDLRNFDASKEVINRLLEPFLTITTILTGTEFQNFFKLRCSDDTQLEMQTLALQMKELYEQSEPEPVAYGDYHRPFANALPDSLDEHDKLKCCVARCARVSYCAHDGSYDAQQDLKLYTKLLAAGHMSPFEHVARPCQPIYQEHWQGGRIIDETGLERNLKGWVTHRTEVEHAPL